MRGGVSRSSDVSGKHPGIVPSLGVMGASIVERSFGDCAASSGQLTGCMQLRAVERAAAYARRLGGWQLGVALCCVQPSWMVCSAWPRGRGVQLL